MAEPLKVVPIGTGKQGVEDLLLDLLEQAREGKITGIVYATEESNGTFGWGKKNITYPFALGLLQRVTHHINREWDDFR